jgi:hypothetical protein
MVESCACGLRKNAFGYDITVSHEAGHSHVRSELFVRLCQPHEDHYRGVDVKRSRGRGRRPQQQNHNRAFDSTGPDVKIRGTAAHVYEKYLQLARDAGSAGDRVTAENYLQHAEHYYRILMAQGPQTQAGQPGFVPQQGQGQQPNANGNGDGRPNNGEQPAYPQPVAGGSAPSFSLAEAEDDMEEGDEAA